VRSLLALPVILFAIVTTYDATMLWSTSVESAPSPALPEIQALIDQSQGSISRLAAALAKCLCTLDPHRHPTLLDDSLVERNNLSTHAPDLKFENSPSPVVIDPYAGSFILFPLRLSLPVATILQSPVLGCVGLPRFR
jgi:hypothetical protein